MGFIRTKSGSLVCDACGAANARKVECPFGWCQAAALCSACRGDPVRRYNAHKTAGCEEAAKKGREVGEREKVLLASGAYVRRSALGFKNDMVHVLFKNKDDDWIGKAMSVSVYRAVPVGEPAVVADFAKIGDVWDAPNDFFAPGGAGHGVVFKYRMANGSSITIGPSTGEGLRGH